MSSILRGTAGRTIVLCSIFLALTLGSAALISAEPDDQEVTISQVPVPQLVPLPQLDPPLPQPPLPVPELVAPELPVPPLAVPGSELAVPLPSTDPVEGELLPLPIPAVLDPSLESSPTDTARPIEGPTTVTGVTEFGHFEQRPSAPPYQGIDEKDLDRLQKMTLESWREHPYQDVWVYDIRPGPDNNWAGWGPPPVGWVTRDPTQPNVGAGLPWPPPGAPPGR